MTNESYYEGDFAGVNLVLVVRDDIVLNGETAEQGLTAQGLRKLTYWEALAKYGLEGVEKAIRIEQD